MALDHPIDQPVLHTLLGVEEAVAFHVVVQLLHGLPRVTRVDLLGAAAQLEHLAGVDLDIGGLALESRRGLVDQQARVGKRHPLALRPAGEDQRAGRHRDPEADRLHIGRHVLHRVVDGESGVQRAPGGVHVDRQILVGVLGREMQQLSDHHVCQLVVDLLADEDDPLIEQPRVDVKGALAARGLLHHDGNQRTNRQGSCKRGVVAPLGFHAHRDSS